MWWPHTHTGTGNYREEKRKEFLPEFPSSKLCDKLKPSEGGDWERPQTIYLIFSSSFSVWLFFRVWNEIFLPLISRADRWWFSFHELCISIFLISRGRKYFLVLIILSLRAKGAIFITHRRKQKVRNRQKMSFEKESFGNFMLRGGLIFFLSLPRGHSCKLRP